MTNFTPRQMEIINVSMGIIAEQGLAELSINKIATTIGIKDSSIYNHFESKKAILQGIFYWYHDEIIKTLEPLETTEKLYMSKIKAYFYSLCNNIEDKPYFIKLIIREFYHYDPYFRDDYISLFVSSRGRLISIIEKAKENNEIKKNLDNDFVASVFWGCVHTLTKEKFMFPDFDMNKNSNRIWPYIENTISTG